MRMRMLSRTLLVVVSLLLVVPALGGFRAAGGEEPSSDPPAASTVQLSEPMVVPEVGVVLDPPGDLLPARSSGEALKIAWTAGSVEGAPTSAILSFAILTKIPLEGQAGRPVWVVTFQGACVPNFGPPANSADRCLGTEWTVLIDDESGSWIASYGV